MALSSTAIEEKNKLATDSIFLIALEVIIPGVTEHIYLVCANQDIVWRSETWLAFDFQIEEIGDTSKGEVPQVELRIANIDRAMEAFIEDYDNYIKQNGYTPLEVYIYVVNSKNLASDDPEVEHYFELKQPKADKRWAHFILGAPNPFKRRFPGNRIMKEHCRYRIFKGDRCGYAGTATSCNRTLTQCREYNNSVRFGGRPGVGRGSITVA